MLSQEKMVSEKNGKAEALCKFGPGGDFVAFWRPAVTESCGGSGRLVKLLWSMVDGLSVLFGLGCSGFSARLEEAVAFNQINAGHKEKLDNAFRSDEAGGTADSASTATAADGGLFGREPMLFPDYSGAGVRIRHKPKHRIRAYRRTPKKRSVVRLAEQGTLFEPHFKSARTA
jgi:hypothetical protein